MMIRSKAACLVQTCAVGKLQVRSLHTIPQRYINNNVLLCSKQNITTSLQQTLSNNIQQKSFHVLSKPQQINITKQISNNIQHKLTSNNVQQKSIHVLARNSSVKKRNISVGKKIVINNINKRNISGLRAFAGITGLVGTAAAVIVTVFASSVIIVFVTTLIVGCLALFAVAFMWRRITGPLYRRLAQQTYGDKFKTCFYGKVDAGLRLKAGAMTLIGQDEYIISRLGAPVETLNTSSMSNSVYSKSHKASQIPVPQIIDITPISSSPPPSLPSSSSSSSSPSSAPSSSSFTYSPTSTSSSSVPTSSPKFLWQTLYGSNNIVAIFPIEGPNGTARVAATASKRDKTLWELTNIRVLFDNWERFTVLDDFPGGTVEPDKEELEKKKKKEEEEENKP